MNNPSSQTSRMVITCISSVIALVTLCFFVLVFFLVKSPADAMQAAPAEEKAQTSAPVSSLFEDPSNVKFQLHNELGKYLDSMGEDKTSLSVYVETADQSVDFRYNCERSHEAASLYKLPLAMLCAEKMEEGTLKKEDLLEFSANAVREEGWNPIGERYLPGSLVPAEEAIECALTYSDNTAAAILYEYLGGWDAFARAQLKYSNRAVKPEGVFDNVCSADQMMDVLRTLQSQPKTYELVLDALAEAPNDTFLNSEIPNGTMMQKYGQIDGNTNAAGFSRTGVPYRIVVLSDSLHCEIDPGNVNEIVWKVFNQAKLKDSAKTEIQSSETGSIAITPAAGTKAGQEESVPAPSEEESLSDAD